MEKSRAIEILKPLVNSYVDHANITMKEEDDDTAEALEMAIEALKAQLSWEDTTSDLISRQAAIDAAKDWYEGLICGSINGLIKRLNALPSAQPEPHEGHWIKHETPDGGEQYECSRCGVLWEFNDGTPEENEAYYCPKCGAKLITK